MIKLEHRHLIAILKSKEFKDLIDNFDNIKIKYKIAKNKWDKLNNDEFDYIHDFIIDTYIENSPIVYERDGEGDFGAYPIRVYGVPGAYFGWAPDFDYQGAFDTDKEAIEKSYFYFG